MVYYQIVWEDLADFDHHAYRTDTIYTTQTRARREATALLEDLFGHDWRNEASFRIVPVRLAA